jgi:hypothetical protein
MRSAFWRVMANVAGISRASPSGFGASGVAHTAKGPRYRPGSTFAAKTVGGFAGKIAALGPVT